MRHRSDLTLAHVLPSAAAAVGVTSFADAFDLGECRICVVCLIDGLGAVAIEGAPDLFDSLIDAEGGSIEAAFPTTTSTGLATLGTGLYPGQHGVVGASFWLPEIERVLSPLHWGLDPNARMVQPEPTVFEVCVSSGVEAVTIAPAAYARSGLTAAALRGSQYRAAENPSERAEHLRAVAQQDGPAIVYVYWPALDRAAHEFGPGSAPWVTAAREVNELLARLAAELPRDGVMLVTADHGMVDTASRLWIEDHSGLLQDVRVIAGEPRMRHIYTDVDPRDVVDRWREVCGDDADVLLRDEAIARGLFGPVDPMLIERIGDVLAISRTDSILASRIVDERVSSLRGQHGGLTDAERRVPALVLRGG